MKTQTKTPSVKVASPLLGDDEYEAVKTVLESGQYVSGARVAEFEQQFADYVGADHAVAVNSGTAAIHAALDAVGIGPGDEVIVPSLTFFSTIAAVIHQAAVPILADISLDNFCLDPDAVARCITPRTRAIMPVHYFGHAAEMDDINAIAGEHQLYVIEDAAQAHGTKYRGRMAGALGDFGAFSFFATKHMTTGEGGAVTTNNAEWAARMRQFRNHGMTGRHDHGLLGYNYRMTEMAAAIGSIQLGKLDSLNAARIRNSEHIIERIKDIPWLQTPKIGSHVKHTYFWCHILIDEEGLGFSTQELIERLREAGIETRNRYVEPLYRQPVLTKNIPPILKLSAGDNLPDYSSLHHPGAERAAGKIIGLPNRPDMTEEEINAVVDALWHVDKRA